MKVDRPVIFFDGICNLCNSSVDFILKFRAKEKLFFVASLQGQTAKSLLPLHYLEDLSSIVFQDANGHIITKPEALLKISQMLQFPFNYLGRILSFIPYKYLDVVYDFMAKKRYNWWGKKAQCRLPQESERFIFLP